MTSVVSVSISAPIDDNMSLIVTATFEALNSASDWGGTYSARCYMIQNSSATYGESIPLSTTRTSYAIQHIFSPIAGYSITCGLDGLVGAGTDTFYNIVVHGELIKR